MIATGRSVAYSNRNLKHDGTNACKSKTPGQLTRCGQPYLQHGWESPNRCSKKVFAHEQGCFANAMQHMAQSSLAGAELNSRVLLVDARTIAQFNALGAGSPKAAKLPRSGQLESEGASQLVGGDAEKEKEKAIGDAFHDKELQQGSFLYHAGGRGMKLRVKSMRHCAGAMRDGGYSCVRQF